MSAGRHGEVVTAVKDVVGLALWLVSINTLFHHSEKFRHPWELLSIPPFRGFIHELNELGIRNSVICL